MSTLFAGFSRVNMNPMLGLELYGYYETRESDGFLDELEINTIALAEGDSKALLMSVDHCGMTRNIIAEFQENISKLTGVPMESIFISATHAHTGPYLVNRAKTPTDGGLTNILNTNPGEAQKQLQQEYYQYFYHKIADAAILAMEDLKPATMSWGRSKAPGIGFIRRYRMKDGSTRTNPGIGNPQIDCPLGAPDEEIGIVKFAREQGDHILLVNYGNHPDVIGGCKFSADWPGHTRRTLERAVPGIKCALFNGTMGDVNHINVNRKDYESGEGYEHSRYMGQVVAGGVLQVLGNLKPEENAVLRTKQRVIRVPSNKPDPADMEEAHRINNLHIAGKDAELHLEGMQLTTVVANAARMVRMEFGPDAFDMTLSAVSIGKVALLGIPGQHFACAGLEMKAIPGWDMILPTSQANGAEGYFPPMSAYKEGGYESVSSNFKAGVSEQLIAESAALLAELAQ